MPEEEKQAEPQVNETISGEGTVNEGDIQSVGAEVGPFRVTISWVPGTAEADTLAAQAFVTELVNDINANAREIPDVFESVLIKRV